MKIPPQSSVSSGIRRPAYVSPNTQSVQVFAYALASPSASPSPQSFAVTTPSPCTLNSDGSKTCTFNVQAPIGMDEFTVKTYATMSPGPSASPLAVFQSGAVNVAVGATPPALNFALTGLIKSVDIAMQSPDPSFTPSTQIATIGTAITSTLLITPRDASNAPILTDTFASPITVSLSPTNAGVSFALAAASQCSPASSASGTSATITCAKDLTNLAFSYNGSIVRDSSNNPIDQIIFTGAGTATAQSAGPTGATGAKGYLALQGAMFTYPLAQASVTNIARIRFIKNLDATYTYDVEGGSNSQTAIGHLDPSNPTAATALAMPFTSYDLTVDHSGNVWLGDYSDTVGTRHNALDCYSSLSTTPTSSIALVTPNFSPQPIQPQAVTTDVNGNVWYYGTDPSGNEWAGWVGPNVCASAPPTSTASAQIFDPVFGDFPVDAQPQKGSGTFLLTYYDGVYAVDTVSSPLPLVAPTPGNYGGSVGVDPSGNAYVGYANTQGNISILPYQGSSFSTTQAMPNYAAPYGISTDGKTPVSRFAWGDASNYAIGVGNIGTAPTISNIALTYESGQCYGTFFDTNGDVWGGCSQYNSTTSQYNATLVHFVRTSIWTAVVPPNPQIYNGTVVPIAILETGNSGPFTATVSDPTAATVGTPSPGYEHTIPLTFTASGSTNLTITVTDAHNRSQTTAFTWHYNPAAARHRNTRRRPR